MLNKRDSFIFQVFIPVN